MEKTLEYLNAKAKKLPNSPGVYIMKNKKKEIIYIGKAKNLNNRVNQYFKNVENHTEKTAKMVSSVQDFEYILTDNEFEALVLECSLIKQYKPKYNILLKDDKGYHYIKITNEVWPKISAVHQIKKDNSTYIGPYTSSGFLNLAVDETLKIFKLPNCNRDFSSPKLNNRPCLNYYIKRCSAPCFGKINNQDYLENIKEAVEFLKGSSSATLKSLDKKMFVYSENMEFEKAAILRDKIRAIEKLNQKQKVVLKNNLTQDFFALATLENLTCIQIFRFEKGKLYDIEDFIFNETEPATEILRNFLQQYYSIRKNIPALITLNLEPNDKNLLEQLLTKEKNKNVKIKIPKRGEQIQIINMCKNNALERLNQIIIRKNKKTDVLQKLKKSLGFKTIPNYIEAYDVSNISGHFNCSVMTVFKQGKPFKSAYRKFKIKSVVGADDYSSIKETIERRFIQYKNQKQIDSAFCVLPDLILLDGGKGHVNAVKPILKKMNLQIPVFGMVKNAKHKTRALTDGTNIIEIAIDSDLFNFISAIQEEVHRFAIKFYRSLHQKSNLESQLTKIPGIGAKRAIVLRQKLKEYFGSLENAKNALPNELIKVKGINEKLADNIYNFFKEN